MAGGRRFITRIAARVALALFMGLSARPVLAQFRPPDNNRLPGPRYPEIVSLYRAQVPAAALAALGARTRDGGIDDVPLDALALKARLLSAVGQYEESARLWRDLAAREAALKTLALRAIVENELAGGRPQAALGALAEIGASSPGQFVDLMIRVADACRSARLYEQAIALSRRARELAGRNALADQASLGLAAALEESGRPAEALDVFRGLLSAFRVPQTYTAAAAHVRRLSARLSRRVEPLTEGDYSSIARRLSAGAQFGQAIAVLEEWRTAYPHGASAEAIDALVIDNLYALRANGDARARCDEFLARYPSSTRTAAVRLTEFRIDAREGRTAAVKARGLAIWRGQVVGATAEQRRSAARLLAEYLVSVGEAEDGLGVYDELYKATPVPGDRIDVLWRSAVAALRAGRRDRAASVLRTVLSMNPGSETVRAATYWLATIDDGGGGREAAVRGWTRLVGQFPYSYYGVRAAERLGERKSVALAQPEVPAPRLNFPDLALPAAISSHPDYRAAALLARAGLPVDAAVYARRLAVTFRTNRAVALLVARATAAAGDHRTAFRLATSQFGQYFERPAASLPDDLWELAYPRAYWSDVQAAAARHGVDPFLMLALMQQESQFDTQARSPVGALGLFQIMSYTAARIAVEHGIAPADEAALMEPGTSAEMAAALLSDLIRLFGGALAPAIAAYNADERRVEAWWQAARGLPEELFIDSIPFRETRGYVREVLANYYTYRRLNAVNQ